MLRTAFADCLIRVLLSLFNCRSSFTAGFVFHSICQPPCSWIFPYKELLFSGSWLAPIRFLNSPIRFPNPSIRLPNPSRAPIFSGIPNQRWRPVCVYSLSDVYHKISDVQITDIFTVEYLRV